MTTKRDNFLHDIWGRKRRCSTYTDVVVLRLLVLAAILSCIASAQADQIALPLVHISCDRTVSGQLLLPVKLTGAKGQKVDAKFILDTGVNNCGITDAMAERLGLKSESGVGDDGRLIMFNGTNAHLARVPLLELGSIPVGNLGCVVFGLKALSDTTGQAVDGIIGNNILLVLPALINLRNNEVTFLGPGPVTADKLRATGMSEATIVPLDDLSNNGTYACTARLESGGKSLQKNMVLDIGSNETMISGTDARHLGLSTKGKPTSSFTLLTGSIELYEGMAAAVTLGAGVVASGATGTMTTREVTVAYPQGALPNFLPPHLGRDVLGRYLILTDFAEKKIYIKPISGLDAPTFVPKITVGGK